MAGLLSGLSDAGLLGGAEARDRLGRATMAQVAIARGSRCGAITVSRAFCLLTVEVEGPDDPCASLLTETAMHDIAHYLRPAHLAQLRRSSTTPRPATTTSSSPSTC
jgi:hypothetical protein